jgi:cobalt-precorrin-5B (C1)-methyltransferase
MTDTDTTLRTGWTTGACAAAAAKAACQALLSGSFPDPVAVTLPKGQQPSFALALAEHGDGWARAGIVKDAGDDPDVTHGALIVVTIIKGPPGSGITFKAGAGVGTVTKPGLPLPPGEPAINPVPRQMIAAELAEMAARFGQPTDLEVTVSVPGGVALAQRTWNPRLGILGGISILGTTGVVVPYSCSAWIHSIQRGIDVARACGLDHVVGATGNTSEKAALALLGLGQDAAVDMGDFAGGMLKYLRRHPVANVTVAGGFAKMAKLAQGHLDLHSKRCQVDIPALADMAGQIGADPNLVHRLRSCSTALDVLENADGLALGDAVAAKALLTARDVLGDAPIASRVLVFDRQGRLVGQAG